MEFDVKVIRAEVQRQIKEGWLPASGMEDDAGLDEDGYVEFLQMAIERLTLSHAIEEDTRQRGLKVPQSEKTYQTRRAIEGEGPDAKYWAKDPANIAMSLCDELDIAVRASNDTGCKDRNGKRIYLGDLVKYVLLAPNDNTRIVYEVVYKVIYDAPSYSLEWVCGGHDIYAPDYLLRSSLLEVVNAR